MCYIIAKIIDDKEKDEMVATSQQLAYCLGPSKKYNG